jgi:Flp pilus assembly protein TadG
MATARAPQHGPAPTHSMSHRLLAWAAGNSGAAAVEFAIVVPVLALVVTAVIDIGFGVHYKMQVEEAAQAGAQWAIKNGFDANAISSAVLSATNASAINASPSPATFCGCANGSSVSNITCGTKCPSGATAGTYVTVSSQMTYNAILGYPGWPSSYNLTAQSTVRLQ